MCIVLIIATAMISGSFGAVVMAIFSISGNSRSLAEPVFPADAVDPYLPLDRNGNPHPF